MRRVVVTVSGAWQTRDMFDVIKRQRAEDAWSYGLLYDLRRTTDQPTITDLRELMDMVSEYQLTWRPRGPVAILATDPILYAVACTYAVLGRAKLKIQAFRDLDEADMWLVAATPQR
jgi:hypothetical protein